MNEIVFLFKQRFRSNVFTNFIIKLMKFFKYWTQENISGLEVSIEGICLAIENLSKYPFILQNFNISSKERDC